ncbi:MAG: hypothetical protein QM803_15495 [Rhodocyclaceae bacterium]
MNPVSLYAMLDSAGLADLSLEDQPRVFGGWHARIRRAHDELEVFGNSREGRLELWRVDGDRRDKLFETDSEGLGQSRALETLKRWLRELGQRDAARR